MDPITKTDGIIFQHAMTILREILDLIIKTDESRNSA